MKKLNKRIERIVVLKNNKEKMLIVSDRRTGESKSDHERRIQAMAKIMIEKPSKSNGNKIDTLLENVITAIDKWKNECMTQGENPVCISHFISIDPETKELSPATRYAIFGEQPEVMGLLKYTNKMLDPNGGEDSLIKKGNISTKKAGKNLVAKTNDLSRRG
ncbi:MAG: hypothetical protein AAB913_03355 [Patescibacteria group bacterium]